MSDRAIEASGSDIEDAIQKGLKRLGLSRTDVIIDVVDEGRKGLLGLGSREAVVRLTPLPQVGAAAAEEVEEETPRSWEAEAAPAMPAEEEPAAEPPADAVAEPATMPAERPEEEVEAPPAEAAPALPEAEVAPEAAEETIPADAAPALPEAEAVVPEVQAAPEAAAETTVEVEAEEEAEADELDEAEVDEEVVAVVQEIVATLMEQMSFDEAEVSVSYTEPDDKTGRVMTVVEIEDGSELNSLIGPHGETLNDLQYLVRLMTGHVVKRRANFLLDVNGYRRKRKEALTKLAERMAGKAVRRGEPVTLEAMNAYDRRLIHIALRDSDEVYTNSVGEGANRRVRIYLQED